MKVADQTHAESLVRAFLDSKVQTENVVVIEAATQEFDLGWVVYYDSKRFVETGDALCALAGNAPIIVERATGALFETGTAEPIDNYIDAFVVSGNPHLRPGSSIRITGWSAGADTIQAIKAVRDSTALGLAGSKAAIDRVIDGTEVTLNTNTSEDASKLVAALLESSFLAQQIYG